MTPTGELIRALTPREPLAGSGRLEETEPGIPSVEKLRLLDAACAAVLSWSWLTIPGLLRTRAYSMAAVRAMADLSSESVGRLASMQHQRAHAWRQRISPDGDVRIRPLTAAWFVVGQRAFEHPLCSGEVLAEQVRHLLDLERHQQITIRIWPERALPAGLMDHALLYELEERDDPYIRWVGYVETVLGGFWSSRLAHTGAMLDAYHKILDQAWSPRESREYLMDMKRLTGRWTTSSYSRDDCVAARRLLGGVQVADTKTQRADRVSISSGAWSAFLTEVKSGQRETAR